MNRYITDIEKFKRLYTEAIKKDKDEFLYNGEVVLVDFAKYVIEYHNSKVVKQEIPQTVNDKPFEEDDSSKEIDYSVLEHLMSPKNK